MGHTTTTLSKSSSPGWKGSESRRPRGEALRGHAVGLFRSEPGSPPPQDHPGAEVRGRELLIGIVLHESAGKARIYTTALKDKGLLCKETHSWIIRFAPPLVISKAEIDEALRIIGEALA